jgi:uncharacterized membrane protein YeaQ/YmgE (transglycosylase-associated protein family)
MNAPQLIAIAVIGLIAGWLASFITGGGNILRYLVTGVLGAFVGGYVLNAIGLNLGIKNQLASQIVTAMIGAVIITIVARILLA